MGQRETLGKRQTENGQGTGGMGVKDAFLGR